MTIQEISVEHHGRRVLGTLYLPEKIPCPMVIFSHGFNGIGDDFTYHAEVLEKNGIGSFTYDFCGGSLRSKSDMQTTEMTIFTEKEDLSAVLDTIKSRDDVDRNHIFLFGGSMGGLVTALTAEEKEDSMKGMILLFPAFCVADDWNQRFPKIEDIPDTYNVWGVPLGRCFFESLHGFNILDNIGKYRKNVFIMHGDKDTVVSMEYSKKAHARYSHSRLEIFPGEGHGFSANGNNRMTNMLVDFIKQNLD